jgi:hypothetical protein
MRVSRHLAEIIRRDVGEGRPPGFFDAVVGGWKGEPVVSSPQDPFEVRDDL